MLVVATSAAGYYLGAPAPTRSASRWPRRWRHGARRRRRRGAQPGLRARHRCADAAHANASAAGRPRDPRRRDGLRRSSCRAAGLRCSRCARTCSAALLALATLLIYLVVYTPMKRRSPLVDAGRRRARRAAAADRLGRVAAAASTVGGLALFAIVFLWQIPHFMAIAWLYRDDYGSAGFPMLPVIDPDGRARRAAGGDLRRAARAGQPRPGARRPQRHASTRCRARARLVLLWLAVRFAQTRTDARRARCSSVDHLSAAALDRDDRSTEAVTRSRSAGGQRQPERACRASCCSSATC